MIQEKNTSRAAASVLQRHVAIPTEHGAWVFLFSPLLIGGFAAGQWNWGLLVLTAAALSAFLMRQPLTIAVKAYSKRRPRSELVPARFWLLVYGAAAAAAAFGLVLMGHAIVLWLVIPALPVLAWYLWLISKRSERRQMLVEILAGGILAFGAPAAYWIGQGGYQVMGWLLWGLCWLQTAGSIIYVYLRLEQRRLNAMPGVTGRWQMGAPALVFNTLAAALVAAVAGAGLVSGWLVLAYAVQLAETVWGTARPAVKVKPALIGVRQLAVSVLFTLIFILAW